MPEARFFWFRQWKFGLLIFAKCYRVDEKKFCYGRRTARRAMPVRILSTAETNQQQIAVIELEGYCRRICSKQPQDWSIVVQVSSTNSTVDDGDDSFVDKVAWGSTQIFGDTQISLHHSVV